ncbi:MAG: hypothetical protein NXI23_10500 [Bacteroidetes bacterium]|jgi:hypothetical protein|nr:hypothetical protein [Bacteroidota bacterium]MDF1867848.1 hypothetical protein [Saprospiraceae bacterium]
MAETTSFQQLEEELKNYKDILGKASDTIIQQDVSKFPIFVIHQHSVDIGIQIVDNESVNGKWSVNASSLEEFVTKQIIQEGKVNQFKTVYKNPNSELCLFVLSELGAKFVFIPRN